MLGVARLFELEKVREQELETMVWCWRIFLSDLEIVSDNNWLAEAQKILSGIQLSILFCCQL